LSAFSKHTSVIIFRKTLAHFSRPLSAVKEAVRKHIRKNIFRKWFSNFPLPQNLIFNQLIENISSLFLSKAILKLPQVLPF